jgi:putative transposase
MEQIRQRHQFVVVGYVVMPEHVHLLFSEPERRNPSLVLAALKQSFAHRLLRELRAKTGAQTDALWSTPVAAGHVWQRRFYDFVVFSEKKRVEKLRYVHRNPVQRGLVAEPKDWLWSSFRHYAYGERGPVLVNETRKAELHIRKIS